MHKIAITQTHDLKTLILAELMGELMSYECEMEIENPPKKSKNLAFRSKIAEDGEDSSDDQMALLTKQFGTFLKNMKRKQNTETSQNTFRPDTKGSKTYAGRSGENNKTTDKGGGIQCHECEGYGHVQCECPNFLRKQKKSLVAQHSDSESKGEEDGQVNCLALSAKTETPQPTEEDSESDTDTEITDESIAEKYAALFSNWEKLLEKNQRLKGDNAMLTQEIEELKEELNHASEELKGARSEVSHLSKFMSMMTKGTNQLDDMIMGQKNPKNKTGLRFENQTTGKDTVFVPEQKQGKTEARKVTAEWTKDTRVCDYCNQLGHIMGKCKDFLSKYQRRQVRSTYIKQSGRTKVNLKPHNRPEQRIRNSHRAYCHNYEVYNHHVPDYYYQSNPYYDYGVRYENQGYWRMRKQ